MTHEAAADVAVLRGLDTLPGIALDAETIDVYARPFWPPNTCPCSEPVRLEAITKALARLHRTGDCNRIDTRHQGTLYQLTPKGQMAARSA